MIIIMKKINISLKKVGVNHVSLTSLCYKLLSFKF